MERIPGAGAPTRGAVIVVAALAVALIPIALAGAQGSAARDSNQARASTKKALKKAGWASNVDASFSDGELDFRSDGVPQDGLEPYYAVPNPGVVVPNKSNSHVSPSSKVVKRQAYNFKITTKPKKASQRTSIFTGPVGVMINGALIFNPYEGDGTTVAMASNFTLTDREGNTAPFLDKCNGHPSPGPVYAYHYHGLPKCVAKTVDRRKGPSHIIGVAWDGFPIYGDRNYRGKKIKASKLDKCNGIKSRTPEFPHGIYHYVLLNVPNKHSSIACLKGRVKQIPGGAYPEAAKHGIAKYGMNMCGPAGSDRTRRASRHTRAS
jgi:YHYH protein